LEANVGSYVPLWHIELGLQANNNLC